MKACLYLVAFLSFGAALETDGMALSPEDEKSLVSGAFMDVVVSRDSGLAESIPAWKLSRKKTQLLHRRYRAIPEDDKRLLKKALGEFQAQTGILLERDLSPKVLRGANARDRLGDTFERMYTFLKTRHPEAHTVVVGIVRKTL